MELQYNIGLLEAMLSYRPPQLAWQLPGVLQAMLPLFHSPLAAPRLHKVYLDMGVSLMSNRMRNLGQTHTHTHTLCSGDGKT